MRKTDARRLIAALLVSLALGCAEGGEGDTGRRDGAVTGDGGVVDGGEECAMEGDPCDVDGDGCTADLCRGGVCVVGSAAPCDDGVACTSDVCRSMGPLTFVCSHPVAEGSCVTDGVCRSEGDRDPDEACRICDTARSQTMWSTAEGSCDDGDACTVNDTCQDGTCTGDPRLDDYEANDTRPAAHRLGNVSDGDSFPKATLQGTLFPDGDEDWFVYNDSDDFPSSIFPRAELRDIPAGSDFDLCLFVDCESSFNSLSCTAGSQTSLGGLTGCCSRNGLGADENVRIDHDCSSADDSADIYVQIRKVSGDPVCDAPYTLRYGDD